MPIALTPPIFCIINSYPVFSLRIPQTPSNPDSQLLDNLAFSFPEKIGGIRRELLQIPTTTSTHLAASAPPTPSPHLSQIYICSYIKLIHPLVLQILPFISYSRTLLQQSFCISILLLQECFYQHKIYLLTHFSHQLLSVLCCLGKLFILTPNPLLPFSLKITYSLQSIFYHHYFIIVKVSNCQSSFSLTCQQYLTQLITLSCLETLPQSFLSWLHGYKSSPRFLHTSLSIPSQSVSFAGSLFLPDVTILEDPVVHSGVLPSLSTLTSLVTSFILMPLKFIISSQISPLNSESSIQLSP